MRTYRQRSLTIPLKLPNMEEEKFFAVDVYYYYYRPIPELATPAGEVIVPAEPGKVDVLNISLNVQHLVQDWEEIESELLELELDNVQ